MNTHIHLKKIPLSKENANELRFAALDILKGMAFLVREAREKGLHIPARIVSQAQDDVFHWAINLEQYDNEFKGAVDSGRGPFYAFELVTKFASIHDKDLRQMILDEIAKMQFDASTTESTGT